MNLKHFIIGVLGYYLMGRLGLFLAIPPGFASSIWPAAGFAFAASLLLNRVPVILGVATGSFILNLEVATQGFSVVSMASLPIPLLISVGAVFQLKALLFLYGRFIDDQALPDQIKDALVLTLLVGPAGCIFGASFGTFALYANHVIPDSALLFTWFTWWTGDTVGVLLFTPMLLAMFSRSERLNRVRKFQVVAPVLIVFCSIVLLFFLSIESRNQANYRNAKDIAEQYQLEIEKRFEVALSHLRAYQAFYMSSEEVTEEEFHLFSRTLLEKNKTLKAVGWIEVVPYENRASMEASFTESGYPGFIFKEIGPEGVLVPATMRERYFPVLRIYPYEDNKQAHGLDLGHNQDRLDALLSAMDKRQPVSTAPIILAQEPADQKAFIVYQPIFRLDTDEQIGFISGVFRSGSMFADLRSQARERGFSMAINDVTDGNTNWLSEHKESLAPDTMAFSKVLNLGTRQYDIEFAAVGNAFFGKDWVSWWVMTAGVIFAILLQALILIITGTVTAVERKVQEKTAELSEALKKADRANEAKTNFLSNISHELRTPMNAIINFIRMSADFTSESRVRHYLHNADIASDTLLRLINHTLDFHKIESGNMTLESARFDFLNVLEKVVAIIKVRAQDKGIDFRYELPETVPDFLVGDSLRLEEVLLNLCSNAVKFTEEGGVTLRLDWQQEKADKLKLRIHVADTGVGIPEALRSKLFKPFRQADDSTTRKFGGTGLGLSISSRIVELMDGSIEFKSEENHGTEFNIVLILALADDTRFVSRDRLISRMAFPAEQPEAFETPQYETMPSPSQQGGKMLSGRKVLVVDDLSVNQTIARYFLENAGAEVVVAKDGQEAVDQVASEKPDLVLMDVQMPVMDGYEATRKLRETYDADSLPILAMTANAMQPDIEKCLDAGMNDHIAKPVESTNMLDKIGRSLGIY